MTTYDPEAWNRCPEAYGGEGGWDEPYRHNLVAWILEAKPTSLLDIGCLDGALIRHLRACGFAGDYLGVDITAAFVERARRLSPEEEFTLGDARALDGRQRGKMVVLANVIMHLDRPWEVLACACRPPARAVFVSTYAAIPACEEPGHGFLNHWFSPDEVVDHVPPGWEVRREVLLHPSWSGDQTKYIYQMELRPERVA